MRLVQFTTCSALRDLRLRDYLKERYDAIPNVFDWDLSMKLHERGVRCLRPSVRLQSLSD